ncbi:hypothetical protein L9F63_014395, partial [Diploptera punctata]
ILKNKGSVDGENGEKPTTKMIRIQLYCTIFLTDLYSFFAQPALFFTAGFETNATTLSFTLYELSLQPDLQKRLRAEIGDIMKATKGAPTYEDVFGLPYLNMVVSETLRKYPPLPLLDRVCIQEYQLPGTDVVLEKNTPVFISLLGLHRDPNYFPEPDRYDPERFSEDNKRHLKPYTYLPFGEGPHNCIGNIVIVICRNMMVLPIGICAVLELATVVVVIYLYYAYKFTYWKKKGVSNPKPLPLVGNFLMPLLQKKSSSQFIWDSYNSVPGAPCIGFYILTRPAIIIRDLNLIKHVLVKDFNIFADRHVSSSKFDTLGTQNLFTLKGAPWKYLRVKLSPTFTSGRIKKMFPLVVKCTTQLSDYLQDHTGQEGPIEVKETSAKYSTDVISTCAFGIESNSLSDPKAEFREFGRLIFHFTRYRALETQAIMFMPAVVKLIKASFFTKQTTDFLRKVFWEVINHREKNNISRDDFLELLIQLKNKGSVDEEDGEKTITKPDTDSSLFEQINVNIENFTGDNLVAQTALFFSAGFETSSITITYTLYELSLHPDIQKRLRAEIGNVMKATKGTPTYEDVLGMQYLNMVVSETLRKYPPLPMLDRVCLQEYQLPGTGVVLEKNTPVFISLLGLHRDPNYFPEPDRYDPERFSEDNKRHIKPYTYLPFGEGPHNCIGMRFGLMAVKTALVHILAEFEVKPCKDTPVPLVFNPRSIILVPVTGIPLKFVQSKSHKA